nr:hypothetical protein [Tanacetum cinerariifolium]
MQTQTSNTLHNAIMEAGGKDRLPILAPGNYVQWKSKIKRYIDTKPNHELIHYFIRILHTSSRGQTSKFQFLKEVLSQQLKRIDNSIHSIVDACPNACEMWKAIERNRGKAIVNSPRSIYDQEPSMVAEDDETSKDKEIDKLMALISLSIGNVVGARETVGSTVEEARVQLNAEQADWRDDTDDESKDQELELHYMYMAQIQEVSLDTADSGPIFDTEQVQKIDQNDDDNDLDNERELLASLIEKLKCEIDDSKNRNKFLETSNKVLIKQLKGEIEDFKNKNQSLESSNNRCKETNNKLLETNKLMYNDFKKSQAKLQRRNDVEYASKVEIDCAKAKVDLISYKMESQKSFNQYTQTINDLNQTISEMKKKLSAHQETISILSQ